MIIIQITGKATSKFKSWKKITTIWKAVVRKQEKTLYFWACIPNFGTDTVEKQGSGCIICAEKAILKDVAGQKNNSGGNKIMTRNSKMNTAKMNTAKTSTAKTDTRKANTAKNQKNSRDCNHVKDREMSSYGQQNREQDEKDEYEKYCGNLWDSGRKSRRRVPYGLCRRFLHTYKTGEKVRSGEGDQDMAGMTLLAADQLDWYVENRGR